MLKEYKIIDYIKLFILPFPYPNRQTSTPTLKVVTEVFTVMLCSAEIWYVTYYPRGVSCVLTYK